MASVQCLPDRKHFCVFLTSEFFSAKMPSFILLVTITYLLAITMEINVADLEGEKRRDLLRRIVCHERGNLRKDFSKVNSL